MSNKACMFNNTEYSVDFEIGKSKYDLKLVLVGDEAIEEHDSIKDKKKNHPKFIEQQKLKFKLQNAESIDDKAQYNYEFEMVTEEIDTYHKEDEKEAQILLIKGAIKGTESSRGYVKKDGKKLTDKQVDEFISSLHSSMLLNLYVFARKASFVEASERLN